MNEYDDPYVFAAISLIVANTDLELSRLLHDAKCIKKHISQEVTTTDFSGALVDCIVQGMLKKNKKGDISRSLADTIELFYSNLDMERLRNEIRRNAKRLGRDIE